MPSTLSAESGLCSPLCASGNSSGKLPRRINVYSNDRGETVDDMTGTNHRHSDRRAFRPFSCLCHAVFHRLLLGMCRLYEISRVTVLRAGVSLANRLFSSRRTNRGEEFPCLVCLLFSSERRTRRARHCINTLSYFTNHRYVPFVARYVIYYLLALLRETMLETKKNETSVRRASSILSRHRCTRWTIRKLL